MQFDKLYTAEELKRIPYKEIDIIVSEYKLGDVHKQSYARKRLLKAFHKYFAKYAALLKGLPIPYSKDTQSFLALFSADIQRLHGSTNMKVRQYLVEICRELEPMDIYNELVGIFLVLLDKFQFVPGVSFSRYITKYMRWAIKDWLSPLIKEPNSKSNVHSIYGAFEMEEPYTEALEWTHYELPDLNLEWVANAPGPLFDKLTRYERFLLYLRYKENLGVRPISERLGRAKDTISIHLQQAIDKLKFIIDQGEKNGL